MLVLRGLLGLPRTNLHQLLQHYHSGHRLGMQYHTYCDTDITVSQYCDIEWFALETNRDHSVVFEIASKSAFLDSFVDYDGYSISSKGFLHTVIDIMVI